MLSIRTPSVQQLLMTFLQKYYPVLTVNRKRVLYRTFFEMLPEADALAELILDFVNGHADKDSDEVTAIISERFVKIVDAESRKSDALFALVFKHGGFCEKTILAVLLTEWTQRKVFKQYCALLAESDFLRAADSLYIASLPRLMPTKTWLPRSGVRLMTKCLPMPKTATFSAWQR